MRRYLEYPFRFAPVLLSIALSTPVSAVTLTALGGQDLDHIYGSYAPRGDCSREPRLTIDDRGFLFHALGRAVRSSRFEHALTYLGPGYTGISAVFFPFPANASNFGPVIMIVNDGEKRGVIRIESDVPRGQRPDPFHAALTRASPFLRCQGTGPATATSKPPERAQTSLHHGAAPAADWNNLASLVGRYISDDGPGGFDLFASGPVAAAIRDQLGSKAKVLEANLAASSPLRRQGTLFWITGNAPHQGGVEQAYVLIDASRRAVQIGLWEKGRLTVFGPPGRRLGVPPDIARLLAESPPEDAIPLPGRPWEVVPVSGRPPIAYVDAAASPNIKSISIFCDGTRPMMAALLNKPAKTTRMTVTWNFAGRLINVPVGRANAQGTFWQASLVNSPLIPMLMQQRGSVMLRINGNLEGEASLAGAPAVLRTVMRPCLRL